MIVLIIYIYNNIIINLILIIYNYYIINIKYINLIKYLKLKIKNFIFYYNINYKIYKLNKKGTNQHQPGVFEHIGS